MVPCRVCGNDLNNRKHVFREKHLGMGDEFAYTECSACGSLSIDKVPENIDRYYPEDYYAFGKRPYNRAAGFLKGKRDNHYLGRSSVIGWMSSLGRTAPPYIDWLKNLELPPGSSILDVGSGDGVLVINLNDAGFRATGIDSFIREPIIYPNGARVLNQTLEDTGGSYDCVMMHHCIEHMASPQDAFIQVRRLLKPGGKLLIRTPVAGTEAWRTYGENWFQLDAPRHFVIFSEEALCRLAESMKFRTVKIIYDSMSSQFWASEQYVKSIALASERSYAVNPGRSIFSEEQISDYDKKASELNARNDGDQASFFFIKVDQHE